MVIELLLLMNSLHSAYNVMDLYVLGLHDKVIHCLHYYMLVAIN